MALENHPVLRNYLKASLIIDIVVALAAVMFVAWMNPPAELFPIMVALVITSGPFVMLMAWLYARAWGL